MDWGKLGIQIAQAGAPILGGMLGGPVGSMVASGAVDILAKALGVDATPDAVSNAIATGDPAIVGPALSAAQAEAQAKWPAIAAMAAAQFQANAAESDSINQTMRAELIAGQKWWAWRNLYGYSVGFEATATSWVILYSLVFNPAIYKNVSESLPFFLSWYGMRFGLLGYIHNQATTEKVAAATGMQPEGVVKTIVKAVTGKK
jgi:hypothetical protein